MGTRFSNDNVSLSCELCSWMSSYSRISSDFRKSSFMSFQTYGCHIYTTNLNSFDDFDDNYSKFMQQRTHLAYINLFLQPREDPG
jgi:hypothetical protein